MIDRRKIADNPQDRLADEDRALAWQAMGGAVNGLVILTNGRPEDKELRRLVRSLLTSARLLMPGQGGYLMAVMTPQRAWQEARIAEGKCGVCGDAPLALDARKHMARAGRHIRMCRDCAQRKYASESHRRSQAVRAAKRLAAKSEQHI